MTFVSLHRWHDHIAILLLTIRTRTQFDVLGVASRVTIIAESVMHGFVAHLGLWFRPA